MVVCLLLGDGVLCLLLGDGCVAVVINPLITHLVMYTHPHTLTHPSLTLHSPFTDRWLLLAGWKLYIAHDVLADMARKRNANTIMNRNDITTNTRAAGGGDGGSGVVRAGGGAAGGGGGGGGEMSVGRIKGGKGDMPMTKRADDDTYLSTTGKAIVAAKKNKHRRATYEL